MSPNIVRESGAAGLLDEIHDGSLSRALQSSFPEHKWHPWKFEQGVEKGFWDKRENQREYLEWLQTQLGFNSLEDWYRITGEDFRNNKGTTLLEKHDNVPSKLLDAVYPGKWQLWRFQIVPSGFWDKKENRRQFMDSVSKQMGFKEMDGWYHVTLQDIRQHGGAGLLLRWYDSVSQLLRAVYPKHPWKFQ